MSQSRKGRREDSAGSLHSSKSGLFVQRQRLKKLKKSGGAVELHQYPFEDWDASKPIPAEVNTFVFNVKLESLDTCGAKNEPHPMPPPPSHVYYAQILDRRQINDSGVKSVYLKGGYEYYVHYHAFDRRLDQWVASHQIRCDLSVACRDVECGNTSGTYIHSQSNLNSAAASPDFIALHSQKSMSATPPHISSAATQLSGNVIPDSNVLTKARWANQIRKRDTLWREGNYNDELVLPKEEIRSHHLKTKVKNFEHIIIGKFRVQTWYFSPIPIEFHTSKLLYFCDFCLSFFAHCDEYHYHMASCETRHPPGDEIYRSEEHNCLISVFEVDGEKETTFCQNVSYLAKFFLDHKTLEYDTTTFFFYIVTQVTDQGCHFLSYFSKEKYPEKNYNLSCIMTLPCHQRKGLGTFMMSLSYGLSKIEDKKGTPETPLSDLGLISYRKYWATELLREIRKCMQQKQTVSIANLSDKTGFQIDDIWGTLQDLGILRRLKQASPSFVSKSGDSNAVMVVADALFDKYLRKKQLKSDGMYVDVCKEHKIHWVPHSYPLPLKQ